jgi:class 3 adenylate cyclase
LDSTTLEAGRDAMRRHAWPEAFASFAEADRAGTLSAHDLEDLAAAAWWAGDLDAATDALRRAHSAHVEAGDHSAAAIVALRLAEQAMSGLNAAVAGGWLSRAERLLEDQPEGAGHAFLALIQGLAALLGRGEVVEGAKLIERSLELARRHRSQDVETLALSLKGQVLLRQGHWTEGLALIDEAAAIASSGSIDPKSACDVYCLTISACSDLGEYRRASEWIEQADSWMQRRAINGYRGVCRVHRAELQALRGAWQEAEREAIDACVELERFRLLDAVGYANYAVGEIRLRMGDFEAAEAAFQRAHEHGRAPQPGLSLLTLARGDREGAARMIAHSLAPGGDSPMYANDLLFRARFLAAQVEIALAGDDLETATEATTELASIAQSYRCDVLDAMARSADGAVALARGAHDDAVTALNEALRLWQRADLPYEGARARTLLGRARLAAGDRGTALLDLRAAKAAFERLGAAPDERLLSALLRDLDDASVDRRAVEKTFMFTDIVTSTDLVAAMGDDAWQGLIRWHDRALSAAFAEHGGEVVRSTGDGFFVTFDRAAAAVACAIAIQRRLAEHRREHGFAPWVRIGMHTAAALRHESDYAGQGVHIAARVGALAEREQILATSATVTAAGDAAERVSAPRSVTFKGVPEPVEIQTVDWA